MVRREHENWCCTSWLLIGGLAMDSPGWLHQGPGITDYQGEQSPVVLHGWLLHGGHAMCSQHGHG